MWDIFFERFWQKKRTVGFPDAFPSLPPRFRGRPFIDAARCLGAAGEGCTACLAVCPTGAISLEREGPALDMGMCIFCGDCAKVCPKEALVFTTDWRLSSTRREALIIRPSAYVDPALTSEGKNAHAPQHGAVTQSLPEDGRRSFLLPELPVDCFGERIFARSFRLRQVTAAGCGACEADLNVLSTVVFDIGRFGMDFVASPRHADGLVLTGPVPRNMREALLKCRIAMPAPKPVIAVGACAISGGLFKTPPGAVGGGQLAEGAEPHVPVDLFIPGCPPHPYTSLDGLLRFMGLTVGKP